MAEWPQQRNSQLLWARPILYIIIVIIIFIKALSLIPVLKYNSILEGNPDNNTYG